MAGLLALALGASGASAGLRFRVEPLAATGDAEAFQPVSMNDAGEVVGWALYPPESDSVDANYQATRWVDGQTTRIELTGPFSQALAINAAGDIAGYGQVLAGTPNRAFTVSNGTLRWLPPIIDGPSVAYAIASNGQIAGMSVVNNHGHLVRWHKGELFDLGSLPDGDARPTAINDSGAIVGYWTMFDAADRLTQTPFIHRDGHLTPLGGGLSGAARDIAENGVVVGATDAESPRAFSWHDGTIELLALPADARTSTASAINDHGLIVGSAGVEPSDSRAVFWIDHEVMELNDAIPHDSRWWLTSALDVNNRGQIIGFGFVGDEPGYFLLTPEGQAPPPVVVPLPPAFATAGLVLAAWVLRRAWGR